MLINPTFRQLEAFVAVAEEASFTRAASALNLSQSALSQAISQLENLIEAKLFDRTTRTVRLTRIGEEFLPKVKGLLADMEAAVRDARRLSHLDVGRVRIACLASMSYRFLPRMIQEFNRRHPGIAVEIRDSITSGIPPLLATGEADLGLTSAGGGDGFDFKPLMRDPYRLVCTRDHTLATRRQVTWSELVHHSLIAMTPDAAIRRKMDEAFRHCGLAIKPTYEVTRLITVIGMVESGLGVTALPALNCPRDAFGALCDRPLVEPIVEQTIGILTRTGRSLSPAATAFHELMTDWVAADGISDLPAVGVAATNKKSFPGHARNRT